MTLARKILFAVACVAVPTAVAIAATSTSPDRSNPKSGCCDKSASCSERSGAKLIVCPISGEAISESECPLCKAAK